MARCIMTDIELKQIIEAAALADSARARDRAAIDAASAAAQALASQFAKESGRGAVLVAAARLDVALAQCIKAVLMPHPGGDDPLFDSDSRILGTFSAKIQIAYRLGLIDRDVEHAIQMIRRVRNEFAHSFDEASLSAQSHRNRLAKPYFEARKGKLWASLEQILSSDPKLDQNHRDFLCLCLVLVAYLEACAHSVDVHRPRVHATITAIRA
jgi:hypothetical protein